MAKGMPARFTSCLAPIRASFDLSDIDGTNGFFLTGIRRRGDAGPVSGAGDLNGDGIDDLVIGAPGFDEAYVIFGRTDIGDFRVIEEITVDITGINDAPELSGNFQMDYISGPNYTLGRNDLSGVDIDNEASELTFTVSNIVNGVILVAGASATSFTAAQVDAGDVVFQFLGRQVSFDVVLTDAGGLSAGPAQTVLGPTVVEGTNFDESLTGTNEADFILGRGGADTISGGRGRDVLVGNAGDDIIEAGFQDDYVDGGTGDDTINDAGGSDELRGNIGNDIIDGRDGQDLIFGGNGLDRIRGGDDADYIDGGNGNDTIFGGAADDEIRGNTGSDMIDGGTGNDLIFAGRGFDTVFGGNGSDTIRGGNGEDILDGGNGSDILIGENGRDTIIGGSGNDVMSGGFNLDTFVFAEANSGNDRIVDFKQGETIDLSFHAGLTFADLVITEVGEAALIDYGFGTIQLDNVDVSLVTADDFLFGV